jgi:hypothetical protein
MEFQLFSYFCGVVTVIFAVIAWPIADALINKEKEADSDYKNISERVVEYKVEVAKRLSESHPIGNKFNFMGTEFVVRGYFGRPLSVYSLPPAGLNCIYRDAQGHINDRFFHESLIPIIAANLEAPSPL